MALRTAGLTVTVGCDHCGALLDATQPKVRLLARAVEAMRRPDIPLGTRGLLNGEQWEVVGYQERSADVVWSEYLLFNPYLGYRYLVDDGRRYSLGRVLDRRPGARRLMLTHADGDYVRFGSSYQVVTRFVLGEFPWRASAGEQVRETDYVRPGTMLACEETDAEISWTELRMLAPGEAERAFGLSARRVPWGGTPSPHEPSPFLDRAKEAAIVGGAATLALLAIAASTPGRTRVLEHRLMVPLDERAHTAVLGPVTLPAAARVTVRAEAGVDNQWVDLDYSLTERRTQESYDVYGTAERYSGSDADGPWAEGDGQVARSLSAVPRGTYDLVVEAKASRWASAQAASAPPPAPFLDTTLPAEASPSIPVIVTISRGGGWVGNLFLALLLLWIWPVVQWARHAGFEKRRRASVAED